MIPVRKFKILQKKIAGQVTLDPEVTLKNGMRIAGFDCAVVQDQLICGAVVLEYPSLKVLEQKTLTKRAPIPYLPTLFAFREGPVMMELYYHLESEPQVLIVDGDGIAHPDGCGLATYLGVELHKPTIGISKALLEGAGEINDTTITLNDTVVGSVVKTKEHANSLIVSPGNLITVEHATEIVTKLVKPPHKMPEPIHLAHKIAKQEQKKGIVPDTTDPHAEMSIDD